MAINKNHEFEELDGIKCGVVEKDVSASRVEFLENLLQYNGYTVVVVPTPPPKIVPLKPAPALKAAVANTEPAERGVVAPLAEVAAPVSEASPPLPDLPEASALPVPETFTVGVTDYTFNSINAIFGRLLHTPAGPVVTLAYWQQKETVSHDETPYYESKV